MTPIRDCEIVAFILSQLYSTRMLTYVFNHFANYRIVEIFNLDPFNTLDDTKQNYKQGSILVGVSSLSIKVQRRARYCRKLFHGSPHVYTLPALNPESIQETIAAVSHCSS